MLTAVAAPSVPIAQDAPPDEWVGDALVYGFDLETAKRLVFFRWLYRTGRLTDG